MSSANPPRRTGRSVWAIVAGVLIAVTLSVGTDTVLHATGVFPALGRSMSDALFGLATAYRIVYGVLGAYVTARLAPDRPMWHALVLGGIGLGVSIMGAAVTWNQPDLGPHWYPLALVALALPQSWLGARIREAHLRASAVTTQSP